VSTVPPLGGSSGGSCLKAELRTGHFRGGRGQKVARLTGTGSQLKTWAVGIVAADTLETLVDHLVTKPRAAIAGRNYVNRPALPPEHWPPRNPFLDWAANTAWSIAGHNGRDLH
jgi:hypothetical protein